MTGVKIASHGMSNPGLAEQPIEMDNFFQVDAGCPSSAYFKCLCFIIHVHANQDTKTNRQQHHGPI